MGALFIIATIAGVLAMVFQQPAAVAPDYLIEMSRSEKQVVTGALLELIMGVAIAAIAIAIFPVLRLFSTRLALGYVVARTAEAMILAIDTVALLTLVTISRAFVTTDVPDASHFKALGGILQAERDWSGHAVLDVVVFPVGALILNYVLYRWRLVPRWLSVWGLGGAASYPVAGVLVMYGLEPLSAAHVVLLVPLAVQEMALAAWLITKGFDATAFASRRDSIPAS